MDIQLEGSVVILDEAHNIEDVARSAGSMYTNLDLIDSTKYELDFICKLLKLSMNLLNFISGHVCFQSIWKESLIRAPLVSSM